METATYKHILIATDGSELAQKAVVQGLTLAKALGSKVTIVTVTEEWLPPDTAFAVFKEMDEYKKLTAEHARVVLNAAALVAKELGVEYELVHLQDHRPAEGVLGEAKKKHCDLIVMSSHGRNALERLLLGGQALKVLTYSKIPVLICR